MEQALVFHDDANEEHRHILVAKTKAGAAHWELGSRLLRFRQTGDWRNVTQGGPYTSFTGYLKTGLDLSEAQARVYMRAAELPVQITLRFGVQAASVLSSMVELTPEEETMEEAMELEVEADDGKLKKVGDMTDEERRRALARLRESAGIDVRGAAPAPPERREANAFRDHLREQAKPHLQPDQIQAKVIGGHPQLDLRAIPVEKAAEIFEHLAKSSN